MQKHSTILKLLNKIKPKISRRGIEIVDYWDADLCAIGLKKNDFVMYISTYRFADSQPVKYDLDIEIDHANEHKTIKEMRNISEADLLLEIDNFPGNQYR